MFAERLGLETGWNCHISFSEKTAGLDEHSTMTGGSDVKVEETSDEYLISHEVPSHSEVDDTEISENGNDGHDRGREECDEMVDGGDLNERGEHVDDEPKEEDEVDGKRVTWRDPEGRFPQDILFSVMLYYVGTAGTHIG